MNKIFKVVWNRTIGSFVVTSELAKGRVKSSSEGAEGDVRASEEGRLKTLFRLTALSAALLGFSEVAWAEIPENLQQVGRHLPSVMVRLQQMERVPLPLVITHKLKLMELWQSVRIQLIRLLRIVIILLPLVSIFRQLDKRR